MPADPLCQLTGNCFIRTFPALLVIQFIHLQFLPVMQFSNLIEVLKERSISFSTGITFIEGSHQEEFLSYQELYQAALRVLSVLQDNGIQPGDELVFQIEHNKTFVIVFWACIAGGIIPVPLTIGQNEEHKQKLFNVWAVLNKPRLIIAASNLLKLEAYARQKAAEGIFSEMAKTVIDETTILLANGTGTIAAVQEDDIAFIQFSSGSTGRPKGVMLTHRNLIANMDAISRAAAYSSLDSTISWMPLTHDMGLIGFHLNPMFSGMNQYLMPTSLFIRMPAIWMDKVSQHKITILSSPNFGYKYFSKHVRIGDHAHWNLAHVRIIYNGAEPISMKLCQEFLAMLASCQLKTTAMCPVYGLAEASLAVSISGLEDDVIPVYLDRNKINLFDKISVQQSGNNFVAFVNVGRPVPYCAVRITDDNNYPVDSEIIGYIQIKGVNVTAGYYNNEDETNRIRVEDGWLKTGDLGFMKDGCLYITGREKDIIFVNGQNYYPHDIERIAEEINGIELNKIAVAGFFNDHTQQEETIAFVFHRGNPETFIPLARELFSFLNQKAGLPIDRIIPVKDIPRTTSGKLQRFKLLERFRNGDFDEIIKKMELLIRETASAVLPGQEPQNEYEEKILAIWQSVLQKNVLAMDDKFFEAGGNSLKAAEMLMLLTKEFQVSLPPETLYEKQTIRELANEIVSSTASAYHPLPVIPEKDHYPVSALQRRLYYFWEVNKQSVAYNIPVALRLTGILDHNRLEAGIQQLIRQHDTLRMSFHLETEPVFSVQEYRPFRLPFQECSAGELNKQLQQLVQPFDLTNGPLFQIQLLRTAEQEYVLFVDFHHIISDGLSVYHFIGELMSLYAGLSLPAATKQYKEYVAWEKENLVSEKMKAQQEYWNLSLQGELPVLEMPLDLQRPAVFDTAGEKPVFTLDPAVAEQLRTLAKANHCTLHVLMFTLYNVLLAKYTSQEDIIVGIPVAGRQHPDLLSMQGMFVNNLPVRNIIKGDEPFTHLLATVKKKIAEAFQNQEYPFEQMVSLVSEKET
jgi:acyl-CoA synthetase (AMP-forming)/AMP-acid ligase II/acyl carrier protein